MEHTGGGFLRARLVALVTVLLLTGCGGTAAAGPSVQQVSSIPGLRLEASIAMPDGPSWQVPVTVSVSGVARGDLFIGLPLPPPGSVISCPYLPEVASLHTSPPPQFRVKGSPRIGVLIPAAPVRLAFTLVVTPGRRLPASLTLVAAEVVHGRTLLLTTTLPVQPMPLTLPTAAAALVAPGPFLTAWHYAESLFLATNPNLTPLRNAFRQRLGVPTATWQRMVQATGRAEARLGAIDPALFGLFAPPSIANESRRTRAEEGVIAAMDDTLRQALGSRTKTFERLAVTVVPTWHKDLPLGG